jgi:hypothetical protein
MATTAMNAESIDFDQIYGPALRPFDRRLSPEALLSEAEQSTGVSDWGGEPWSETAFRERLAVLCESLETESDLTALGRSRAHSRLHLMLCSRLLTLDWRRRHLPVEPKILTPFVGSGSGRTGTSFTHQLLSQDPENLAATEALCMMPVPPPGEAAVDARRNAFMQKFIAFQGLDAPEVEDLHPFAPENPQEDTVLQEGMCGPAPMAFFNVPSFVALVDRSEADAYAWQKAVMQVLQSGPAGRAAKRWALKSPTHIRYMDVLMRTFPDARVYVNHRDPLKVLASHCSMFATFFRLNSRLSFDPKTIGTFLIAMHKNDLDAYTAWRAANPQARVIDVQYTDLVADPVGQAERIYGFFGLELSQIAKQKMSDFLKINRHGQGARVRADLSEFGLTEAAIEAAFAPYMQRYDVVREARAKT